QALVQNHGDITAKRRLNLHRDFRANERRRSVEMILKSDALLGHLPQFRQGENLISAAVRQNRPGPIHELMKTAEVFDHFESWPDESVIGVAQDNLRFHVEQFA